MSKEKSGFSFMRLSFNLLRLFSLPAEIFLHKKIGERYFNLFEVISTGTILWLSFQMSFERLLYGKGFGELYNIDPFKTGTPDYKVKSVFIVIYLLVAIYQIINAKKRHGRGEEIHTQYNGEPRLMKWLPLKESVVKLYIEPLFLILFGFFLAKFISQIFWIYLEFAAISLFIKGQLEYMLSRKQYLDAFDKKIEADVLTSALEGKKNASDNKGFSIPGPKVSSEQSRKGIADMYHTLDGNLQKLMLASKNKEDEPVRDKADREQEPIKHNDPTKIWRSRKSRGITSPNPCPCLFLGRCPRLLLGSGNIY